MFGTLADFDRAASAKAHALGLKVHHRPGAVAHLGPSTPGSRRAARAATTRRPTGTSGPTPQRRRHAAQQLAVDLRRRRLAMGAAPRRSTTCTISSPQQPDLNFHNPEVQDALLDDAALLARARRRRLPARRDQLLLPRPAAARQPAAARRTSATARGFSADNPYALPVPPLQQHAAREPAVPRGACARCSTSIRTRWRSARSRPTIPPPTVAEYTQPGAAAHGLHLRAAEQRAARRAHPQRPSRTLEQRAPRRLAVLGDLEPRRASAWSRAGATASPTAPGDAAHRRCCARCAARSASTRARSSA